MYCIPDAKRQKKKEYEARDKKRRKRKKTKGQKADAKRQKKKKKTRDKKQIRPKVVTCFIESCCLIQFLVNKNIAKGTTDPGVDCFNQ